MLYKLILFVISINAAEIVDHTRIVGGKSTIIGNFPYHLSVRYNNNPICGGTLLSQSIGISAAHCFQRPGSYTVRLGSTYLITQNFYDNAQIIHIKQVIVHPKYNQITNDYDVALLFLNRNVRYSGSIQPAKLPTQPSKIGEFANITGWGYMYENVPVMVEQLRYTQVKLMDQNKCRSIYRQFIVTPRMFCAGYTRRDSCQGDSGGGLVINNTIYGVISWGVGCANPAYPGVYTNITAVLDFIREYGNF